MGEDSLDLFLIERADGDRGGTSLLLLSQVSQPCVVFEVEGAAHQQESHVGVRPGLANQGGNRIEDLRPPAGYHTNRVQLLYDQQAIPARSQASQDRNRGLLAPQQLAPDLRGTLSRIQPVEAKRQERPTCLCDPTHDLTGCACLPHPGRSDKEDASRGLVRVQKDVDRLIGLSPRKREVPNSEFLGLEVVLLALPQTGRQISILGDVGGTDAVLGENIPQLRCRDAAVYRFKGEHREHA